MTALSAGDGRVLLWATTIGLVVVAGLQQRPEDSRVSEVTFRSSGRAGRMCFVNARRGSSDPPMLWPASEDQAVRAPERQLLDAIVAGELDEHLVAIADAIHARREL